MTDEVTPFAVAVTAAEIDDLHHRLDRTRWPDQIAGSGWAQGADTGFIRALCGYWRHDYDWAGFAARQNRWPHFVTRIDGLQLHFLHIRSPEPAARPLLISHGWPSSPTEFLSVIGPLTDPVAHGGRAADAFHLVIPSLPGFGWSGPTMRDGVNSAAIADAFAQLMTRLGYQRFFAQGGDKGVLVTMLLAAAAPDRVAAIHLTLVPGVADPGPDPRAGLTPMERAFLDRADAFQRDETGYQAIQRTKPLSLAYGLTDSPAALAAWLVEKYRAWSDCDGDVLRRFGYDALLDIASLYWLTGTIGSSMRLYHEDHAPANQRILPPRVETPTGHAHFPAEILYTPRRWAERRFNIRHWREMPEGGHFPAAEVPDLFVDEMRSFFAGYRALI